MGQCDLSGITALPLETVTGLIGGFGGQGCTRDVDTQYNPTPLVILLVSDEG